MTKHQIRIIYGGIFPKVRGWTPEKVKEALDFLETEGIRVIDTAACYLESEELLGVTDAATRFTIDTKVSGGLSESMSTTESVIQSCENSLTRLRTTSVGL